MVWIWKKSSLEVIVKSEMLATFWTCFRYIKKEVNEHIQKCISFNIPSVSFYHLKHLWVWFLPMRRWTWGNSMW